MSSQNISGSGCRLSLEYCLTNLFALTDLSGIRWKRLRSQPGPNMDVVDDPVLASYARCLRADILCAWARVSNNDGNDPPGNFMEYAKELWVFWYGDEPQTLHNSLATELQEFDQGSWEANLLSYECRTFLFKALHNVIERCLMAKGFVRVGKWFVQPHTDSDTEQSAHLSFSFQNFFLHGESTVCVSIDVEKHPPLYSLTPNHIKDSVQGVVPVILAPYGLSGRLTGSSVSPVDKSLADWLQFYPLSNTPNKCAEGEVSPMIEVAVGGVRLKYPSSFVLTTNVSDTSTNSKPVAKAYQCGEGCLKNVVKKSAYENIMSGKRADEEPGAWPFQEPSSRVTCACQKAKLQKHKKMSSAAQLGSPKVESKRPRAPYHRRSPPLDEGLINKFSTQTSVAATASSGLPGAAGPSLVGETPQTLTKDLMSPASFIHPSPVLGTVNPLSVKTSLVDEEHVKQEMKPPPSVPGPKSAGTPAYTKPVTPPLQQEVVQQSSTKSSPVKDICKRPRLPSAMEDEEELNTDTLYKFSSLDTWLDYPIKKFRSDGNPPVAPKSYSGLSHPLERLSNGGTSAMETTAYFLPNTVKTEKIASNTNEGVISSVQTDSLMTESSLKARITDLDNLFEDDDDESAATEQQTTGLTNGVSTGAGVSGGASMYSANATGSVCSADLCKIYPTPPSNDINFALSPVDHLHHLPAPVNNPDQEVHSPESTTSLFRNNSITKYLSISEYQPIDLPSQQQPVSMPQGCKYEPGGLSMKSVQPTLMSPLTSVENLPSTLLNHQPSSMQSSMSAPSPNFYPMGRTPLGFPEGLQSPSSVLSHQPKSATGMLSSVEGPATHGAPTTNGCQSLPEGQSLLVNMTLTDSMLNLYKDQNFDSCGLCVCNMNILGNDLGLYLPREKHEAQYKCSCGFSAVVNKFYGYCAGLFYEDESEIINERDDRFDKLKLRPLIEKSANEVDKIFLSVLKDQFATRFTSLLTENTNFSNFTTSTAERKRQRELRTMSSIINTALDTGQFIPDTPASRALSRGKSQSICKWARDLSQRETISSAEAEQLLKSLQPLLQDAIQKKRSTSLWDHHSFTVSGPMSWQNFFKLAGRNCSDELLEPQPVPPLLVGAEDDWLRVSPFSLRHWDKLQVKPYGGERSVSYVVIAPESDYVMQSCKRYFRELSQVYEQCQLGKHVPYQELRDGILRVGKKLASNLQDRPIANWFNKIDCPTYSTKLKLLARVCRHQLAPLLSETVPELFPGESKAAATASSSAHGSFATPPSPAPLRESFSEDKENATESRYRDVPLKSKEASRGGDTALVVYIIDPFTGVCAMDREEASASTLGLFMCYQELLAFLPDNLKNNTQLQILPLHTVLSNEGHSVDVQVLQSTAFSVYSKVNKQIKYSPIGRALTGFGPIADCSSLCKKYTCSRQSLPPFILAPNRDTVIIDAAEQNTRVLFCSYCLSEDQRWLLTSVVNENGELLDTNVINIHVPNRSRRRKATVIKHGIQKLFEYLISTMSKCVCGWRLVIGRIGRLGHGELRVWSRVLSRKSLIRSSKQMREACQLCSSSSERQCCLLGACLVSIEPHASFNILQTDAPKEDKKGNSCPLSPSDASVTHILVIPNSTTAGGNQSQNETQMDLGDMNVDDGLLEMGELEGFEDIFGAGGLEGLTSPTHSPNGSPTHNMTAMAGLAGGIPSRRNTISSVIEGDEQVNLLQQPLSMGYIISSAPTGRLPNWFWSAAPLAQNTTPTVLKSALHFHCVSSHQEDMGGMTGNQKSVSVHPLDSSTTCEVLRFVLDTYNRLSWLTMDPVTNERKSCLPIHMTVLAQLYQAMNTFL